MEDAWFAVMHFIDLEEIVIMSYVNQRLFTITRRFEKLGRKPCDLIYSSIVKQHFTISKFFITKQYNISDKAINKVIEFGNFELLNRINYCDRLNEKSIISAINNGNLKMVKFIRNKLADRYQYTEEIWQAVIKTDNVSIYQFLIGGSLNMDRLVMLIDHNCVNIIERYRCGNNIKPLETIVLRHANFTHNQFMTNHCFEHDYGKHPGQEIKLGDYL